MSGHFTASAKRLRAEHRRPKPHGDLTDSFVPSDGRAALIERLDAETPPALAWAMGGHV